MRPMKHWLPFLNNTNPSVETRPPKLHNLLQSVSPFHPWHFMSLTPRSFARFPSCILLFTKLVCKLFKVDLVVTFFGSHFRMCLWEMDASTVNSGFRVPVELTVEEESALVSKARPSSTKNKQLGGGNLSWMAKDGVLRTLRPSKTKTKTSLTS